MEFHGLVVFAAAAAVPPPPPVVLWSVVAIEFYGCPLHAKILLNLIDFLLSFLIMFIDFY